MRVKVMDRSSPAGSDEYREDVLELKRKTLKKMGELTRRERELKARKRELVQARKRLEKLSTELAEKESGLREKEELLALWEKELKAMGEKLAKKRVPKESPTPSSPPSRRKRRIVGWRKKGRRATKSS
ncbi:MAG: hypothetical protein KAW84_02650 [Thermoplasmata archaeon]|nr:hypothetical protein [Thermoplasmata archaeon]